MTLRDTLKKIKADADERAFIEAHPTEVVNDWISSLTSLFGMTEDYLKSYVEDGFLTLGRSEIRKKEEIIGEYTCEMLKINIVSPSLKIFMRPIERIVAGGAGRVDLYREFFTDDSDNIFRLLRVNSTGMLGSGDSWTIQVRPPGDLEKAIIGRTRIILGGRDYINFSQSSFESALEYLINL